MSPRCRVRRRYKKRHIAIKRRLRSTRHIVGRFKFEKTAGALHSIATGTDFDPVAHNHCSGRTPPEPGCHQSTSFLRCVTACSAWKSPRASPSAVLALASGVYTYLGVRDLLNGNATVVFFAAVIYSVAVSIGIYAFWTFLLRFLPHVTENRSRGLLFGCMGLGSLMIIAMSAWLNASALAGAAAIQQHLAVSVQSYTRDLDRAHSNVLAVQSLVPDIQMAATRFSRLAEAERAGSLTGTAGSGTVVQLADADVDAARQSREGGHRFRRPRQDAVRAGRQASREDAGTDFVARPDQRSQRCLRVRGHVADGRDRSVAADLGRAGGEARRRRPGRGLHRAGGRRSRRSRRAADQRGRPGRKRGRGTIRGVVGGRVEDPRRAAGRARPLPAALDRRSGAALCRRLHSELGRRDLDRSDAGGAGADLLRGACLDPPRGPAGSQCRDHDRRRISSRRCTSRARWKPPVRPRSCRRRSFRRSHRRPPLSTKT